MPIKQARAVFEDAIRSFTQDTIIHEQGQIIHMQRTASDELAASYRREIGLLNQKVETQKENTGHMERLALSYKSERDYYIKREKKQRRKKNLSTVIILILAGALMVK